ncbi:MAG: RNase P subunit p30 family protein [Candidatus Bathyarchaeota archaeon]|jgi:RNase P/RNase MRP subunit p30|nr:RNase P subunit p30 family protein [Candidatus Bathyarchaeota archaeon]
MTGIYADLHLRPNLKNSEQTSALVTKALQLGYRLVAVTFSPPYAREEIEKLRSLCKEAKLDITSRIDLQPKTPNELLAALRRFRREFEVIAVLCWSKNVARQAAKDRRVDLLNFPSFDYRQRFFDKAEAELAASGLASLEIDMEPLLKLEGEMRIRLLSTLRREAAVAKGFHVPIVVSSGVSDAFLMRKPREMAALATLFGIDMEYAQKAVSKIPVAIVKRNREKLEAKFVAPGIRVIRRGKDC